MSTSPSNLLIWSGIVWQSLSLGFLLTLLCLKIYANAFHSLDNPWNFRKDGFERGEYKLECYHFASDHIGRPEWARKRVTTMPVFCLTISSIKSVPEALRWHSIIKKRFWILFVLSMDNTTEDKAILSFVNHSTWMPPFSRKDRRIPLSHGTTNPGLPRLRNPCQTRFPFTWTSVCLFYHLICNRLVLSIWALFHMFICALFWWRRRRSLRGRKQFFWRRMAQLTLKQDVERAFFLAAMMTAATEATLTRLKTVWTKCRNQRFFNESVSSWDADEFKRNFCVSKATFQFLCVELAPCLDVPEHGVFLVASNSCLWIIASDQIANKALISSSVHLRPRSAIFNSLRTS